MENANPRNYQVGNHPLGAAVGDFNGNGKKDLAIANAASGTVSVLLRKGGGAFQSAVNYNAGNSPTFVAVADLNGDHKLDLAVANGFHGTISILLGKGDGTFQPLVQYSAGSAASFVAVADFNHDGRLDLLVSNAQGMISVGVRATHLLKPQEPVLKCGYGSSDERSPGRTTHTGRDSADCGGVCNQRHATE